MQRILATIAGLTIGMSCCQLVHGEPIHATQVVEFQPGLGGTPSFNNPAAVLGAPTRYTDPTGPFGGAVTPFNAPFGASELLSIGASGYVTVRFPVRVHDNPRSHHHGTDFIVFGNAFYFLDFATGLATGGVLSEPGVIEVSQDGVDFVAVSGAFADTAFPTNGFLNPTGPFDRPPPNAIPTDFGIPVNPLFDPMGLTLEEIIAGYGGSGGGTPVDISGTGFDWIQYVRVRGAAGGVEVDGFAVVATPVPEPTALATWAIVSCALVTLAIRKGAGKSRQGA